MASKTDARKSGSGIKSFFRTAASVVMIFGRKFTPSVNFSMDFA